MSASRLFGQCRSRILILDSVRSHFVIKVLSKFGWGTSAEKYTFTMIYRFDEMLDRLCTAKNKI